jgi:5-methylcytosine-specific restriction enzyme A
MTTRKYVLDNEPLCRGCAAKGRLRRATQVDHIKRLVDGGNNDPDNLQPLCKDCHDAKTATENGSVKVTIGVDGYAV